VVLTCPLGVYVCLCVCARVCAFVYVRAGGNGGADVSLCASSGLPMPRTEPGETFFYCLAYVWRGACHGLSRSLLLPSRALLPLQWVSFDTGHTCAFLRHD
jgi:hypothetical protein